MLTFPLLPNLQLLGELRYNEEGLPALAFLWFKDVSKYVISNIEDILASDVQQISNEVWRSCILRRKYKLGIQKNIKIIKIIKWGLFKCIIVKPGLNN